MIGICLRSCYSGPNKISGRTFLVKTFFWFSPNFSGKNNSSADVKALWVGGAICTRGWVGGAICGWAERFYFSKRGDCVKMLKTSVLDDDFKMANKVFWQTIRRLRGK